MDIKITSREAIKPCSPTPQHLRTVKLSLLDQLIPDMYVPLILFYPFITSHNIQQNPIEIASERSQHLRETLSKALALYYPFAGRLRNNLFIEGNDEGAEFVEAKAAFPMAGILKNPDPVMRKKLLAAQPESRPEFLGGFLLLVQATIFDCGGIALSLSFWHKIADACTIRGFVRSWAKAEGDHNPELLTKPEFGQTCDLFPPILESKFFSKMWDLVQDKRTVTRRYVFTAEKIAALKSIAASDDRVRNPTRVEAVSGFLWKCAMKATASSRSNIDPQGSPRTSFWRQAMNIRKRVVPPLGDNVAGNLVWVLFAKTDDHQEVDDLRVLVDKIRKGIEETGENCSKKEQFSRTILGELEEYMSLRKRNLEFDSYGCTSWCRFGFYEADFGWEKPSWVSMAGWEFKNTIVLVDTRDGDGIEAWLMFTEQDMAFIETNQDLLAFASPNPSAL